MENKITIYTEKIYFHGKEISDPKEIAKIIHRQIFHLGKFTVYHRPIPNTWWKKLLFFCSGGY